MMYIIFLNIEEATTITFEMDDIIYEKADFTLFPISVTRFNSIVAKENLKINGL